MLSKYICRLETKEITIGITMKASQVQVQLYLSIAANNCSMTVLFMLCCISDPSFEELLFSKQILKPEVWFMAAGTWWRMRTCVTGLCRWMILVFHNIFRISLQPQGCSKACLSLCFMYMYIYICFIQCSLVACGCHLHESDEN